MYAVTISSPGGPEVLVWREVPDPVPGPGEVLIEVAASAVNRADLLQRAGHYNPPPGSSPYPGLECSGRVLSDDSGTYQPGDEVCALLAGGGYAERVAVPASQVLPVPRGFSMVEAATLPEVACTVWSNVTAKAGETLLVHGGGSGIGTFAIQFGRALGCRVITTARAAKHEALYALGADLAIDYSTEDFVAAVRKATDDRGVDVILDIVGGAYLARNIDALATNGRLAIIALQGGSKAELDLRVLMTKRVTVSATTLRSRPLPEKADIVRGVGDQIWPLIEAGAIRPVIHARLPLSRAPEAHQILESNTHIGKVLLLAR